MHNDAPRYDPLSGKELPKYVTYNSDGPMHRRENPYRMRFPWALIRSLGGTKAIDLAFPTLDALLASKEFKTLSAHVASHVPEGRKTNQDMQALKKKRRREGGPRSEASKQRAELEYRALKTNGTKFHPDIVWQPKNRSWLVSRNFGTGWRWRGTAFCYKDAVLIHKGCINLRGPEDVIGSNPDKPPKKRRWHARDLIRRLHKEGVAAGGTQERQWENIPVVRTSMLEPCNDEEVCSDEEGGKGEGEGEGEAMTNTSSDDDDDGVEEEEWEGEEEEGMVELQGVVVETEGGEGAGGSWERGATVTVEAEDDSFWRRQEPHDWDKRSTSSVATAATAVPECVWSTSSGRISKAAVRYNGLPEGQQRSHNIQNRKKHAQGSYKEAGIYFVHMKLRGVHASARKARRVPFTEPAFVPGFLSDEAWGRSE